MPPTSHLEKTEVDNSDITCLMNTGIRIHIQALASHLQCLPTVQHSLLKIGSTWLSPAKHRMFLQKGLNGKQGSLVLVWMRSPPNWLEMTKASCGQDHWHEKERHNLKKNELYTSFLLTKAMHVFLESEGFRSTEKQTTKTSTFRYPVGVRGEGKNPAHIALAGWCQRGSEGGVCRCGDSELERTARTPGALTTCQTLCSARDALVILFLKRKHSEVK